MSLSPDEADKAIQDSFFTAWGVTTPIAWDNKTFDAEGLNIPYVRLSVQFAAGSLSAMGLIGQRCFRNTGTVFVQVFTPVGGGKSPNTVLATQARNVFRGVQLPGGLWFRDEGITHVGPEGRWYQQNVTANFIFDEDE